MTLKNHPLDSLQKGMDIRFGSSLSGGRFAYYQTDPIKFGKEVLGESYPPDIEELLRAVAVTPVVLARSPNATGKTFAAASVAAWFYLSFPDSQVYCAAAPPEGNLRRLLWGEVLQKIHTHPELFRNHSITDLHIQRSPRSFITGVLIPSSGSSSEREGRFSGKHAPNLMFILDEGDTIPSEVYTGIEACGTGGNFRLLVLFNPRARRGPVYKKEQAGEGLVIQLSAFRHPNVTTGADIFPGAVTRDKTVQRINEWCNYIDPGRDVGKSQTFQLPDFLVGTTAPLLSGKGEYPPLRAGNYQIINPAFSYMVLGEYPSEGSGQLISIDWIDAARKRWDDAMLECNGDFFSVNWLGSGVAGLDISDSGEDFNSLCFRFGDFVPPIKTWSEIDILVTADRASVLCKQSKVRISSVFVDATGVGAGVSPQMRRNGVAAIPVMVATSPTKDAGDLGEFRIMRDQLWWLCREWLRTQNAMLPPDKELIEELLCPTYEVYNGKIEVMPKSVRRDDERGKGMTMKSLLGRSPDKAESLILTFFEGDLLHPDFMGMEEPL